MILPIYVEPQPVLHQATLPVAEFDEAFRVVTTNMRETMHAADGIGLAAPQIGNSRSFFVTELDGPDTEPDDRIPYTVFANPEIIWRSQQKVIMEEACLSIPDVIGSVKRPSKVTLRYQNEHGKQLEKTFSGLFARVVQHEFDHLRGILFTDYVPEERRQFRKAPQYLRI